MSNVNLLEGDTIKLKCSVKLKSPNQLHLFEKDWVQFENQVRINHPDILSKKLLQKQLTLLGKIYFYIC